MEEGAVGTGAREQHGHRAVQRAVGEEGVGAKRQAVEAHRAVGGGARADDGTGTAPAADVPNLQCVTPVRLAPTIVRYVPPVVGPPAGPPATATPVIVSTE